MADKGKQKLASTIDTPGKGEGSNSNNDHKNTQQQTQSQASNKGNTGSQASTKREIGQQSGTKEAGGAQGISQHIFGDNSSRATNKEDKGEERSGESIEKQKGQIGEVQYIDGEDMANNIQKISEEADLSPRQSSSLKDQTKKGRFVVPLQVRSMIEKIIFQNIRSVNSQKSFDRLIELKHRHHYSFVALMESFQNPSKIEEYRRKLGFSHAAANFLWKYMVFLEGGMRS